MPAACTSWLSPPGWRPACHGRGAGAPTGSRCRRAAGATCSPAGRWSHPTITGSMWPICSTRCRSLCLSAMTPNQRQTKPEDQPAEITVWAPDAGRVEIEVGAPGAERLTRADDGDPGRVVGLAPPRARGIPPSTTRSASTAGSLDPTPAARGSRTASTAPAAPSTPRAPWRDGTWAGPQQGQGVAGRGALRAARRAPSRPRARSTRLQGGSTTSSSSASTSSSSCRSPPSPGRWNWGYDGVGP